MAFGYFEAARCCCQCIRVVCVCVREGVLGDTLEGVCMSKLLMAVPMLRAV